MSIPVCTPENVFCRVPAVLYLYNGVSGAVQGQCVTKTTIGNVLLCTKRLWLRLFSITVMPLIRRMRLNIAISDWYKQDNKFIIVIDHNTKLTVFCGWCE